MTNVFLAIFIVLFILVGITVVSIITSRHANWEEEFTEYLHKFGEEEKKEEEDTS